MNYLNCSIVLIIFINILNVNGQYLKTTTQLCNTKETCGECIQEAGCIWCSKDVKTSKTENFIRCIAESDKTTDWCPDSLINNPKSYIKIIKDLPLKSVTNENDEYVQIRPQRVHLKLRRNEEYKLHFQYAQAVDYPVDLYYLMDLSGSMWDDKNNLAKLSHKLSDAMLKLTKNFRLGFGSFVDKVILPFSYSEPVSKNEKPCTSYSCTRPYSYKHTLSLTSDISQFTKEVENAKISLNFIVHDIIEGGFDGILQSIVCTSQIGWRKNATRLLVFSTDAESHLAGDGKLAGIVEPHDGGCYLNDKGEYTHALKFDYPSISFINRQVRKHNIDLLFAVTNNVKNIYSDMANHIAGAQLGILDSDSKNVVELVSNVYKKLQQTVVMIDNARSDVHIKYLTSCLNGKTKSQTNNCSDIRYNKTVDFIAVIRPTSCENRKQIIEIKPRSSSESLIVELEVICDCDCEHREHATFEANSPSCNSSGSLTCGVCTCNSGRSGKFCQCDNNTGLLTKQNLNSCKVSNKTGEPICSGRGRCECGKCICDKGRLPGEKYSGTFCQCDNFSCMKSNNMLCSGHGTCECRQCNCDSGFNGTACECDTRPESCIERGKTDKCSGVGECRCGECICPTEPKRYWGRYCEMCSDCLGSQRCLEFRDCVECQAFPNTGKYSVDECNIYCANMTIVGVNNINDDHTSNNDKNFKICKLNDNNGCIMYFKYYTYDLIRKIETVYVQMKKDCPFQAALSSILLLVTGTMVLGGLVLLAIWKIVTEVHDKREFARFQNERANSKWANGGNPLYKSPTTTIRNPVFEQNE